MKCFYHPQVDAVGICKNCSKGICVDCTVDVGNGIACKNSTDKCGEEVRAVNTVINKNKMLSQRSGSAYSIYAIFLVVMGAVFLVFSLYFGESGRSGLQIMMILAGMAFVAYAGYLYFLRGKLSNIK